MYIYTILGHFQKKKKEDNTRPKKTNTIISHKSSIGVPSANMLKGPIKSDKENRLVDCNKLLNP